RADGSVTATTASGAIRIGRMTHGRAKLMNGSGNIEVGIGEGSAASIDANSERGAVHNFVSPQGAPDPSDPKVMVHARTRHGDIIIRRAASGRSRSERDLDQLRPARLRTFLRHLGEPCFAEVTPRVPLDPGRIRVGAVRQSAYADAGREQPSRLFVLAEA